MSLFHFLVRVKIETIFKTIFFFSYNYKYFIVIPTSEKKITEKYLQINDKYCKRNTKKKIIINISHQIKKLNN